MKSSCCMLAILAVVVTVRGAEPAKTIDLPFTSHDNQAMFGRLTLPSSPGRHAVVIYVQTAEGATVDMKRPLGKGKTFNYYDLYRTKLPEMNVAFFSYEGRGIRMGSEPPRYEQIDWDVYNTSTLDNKVRDILTAVKLVRANPAIDPARVFLMGASEGTLLAVEAASRAPKEVSGLVLYAMLSTTLKDALKYMACDGNFMNLCKIFDTNKDGRITREEYDADPMKIRQTAMKGVAFEVFDRDQDGVFTVEDMRVLRKPLLDGIEKENMDAVNAFLKPTAVVSVPTGWVQDHFAHAPMWTFLSTLSIPVGIFHGSADNLTPIQAVRELEARSTKAGKTNLRFQYFEGLDHSLGISTYFVDGTMPAGHRAIFDYIRSRTAP